jgi:general secretion pathway protein A
MELRHFFDFKKDPFATDLRPTDLMSLPNMISVQKRIEYGLECGGGVLVTGDVGSGKSTSLRWAISKLPQSAVQVVTVVGQTGGYSDILRSISSAMGIPQKTNSKAKVQNEIRSAISETVLVKRQKMLLLIDECHLMSPDVYAELHTLTQFELDSKNLLTLVLCGQNSAQDKLQLRSSAPMASRIIAKSHLTPLSKDQTGSYIAHHQTIAGSKHNRFDDSAITSVYQGSAGVLRKINLLCKGGLEAAATQKSQTVTAEHIRIAASEIL